MMAFVRSACTGSLPGHDLPHVADAVYSFLAIHPSWTVEAAALAAYPRLISTLLSDETGTRPDERVVADASNRGLDIAAAEGRLEPFEGFARHFPNLVITNAANVAAQAGQIEIVNWLLEYKMACWTPQAAALATKAGHLTVMQRISEVFPVAPGLVFIALKWDHDTIARWLWARMIECQPLDVLEDALSTAKLPMAVWMLSVARVPLAINIDIAARRGDLEWLHWAQANGAIATTNAMDDAAGGGHLDVVEWLHTTRVEGCTTEAMTSAAKLGHLRVIQWLWSTRGQTWTTDTLFKAAINGHLDVLEWLLTNSTLTCPHSTFDHAAGQGHLEILQWMTTNAVSTPSHRAFDWAASNGHLHILQYLRDQAIVGTTRAMDEAAANGHLFVVQWLHEETNLGCTTAAMDVAALYGHHHVIEWLQRNRAEGSTFNMLRNAARRGSLPLVQSLIEAPSSLQLTSEIVDEAIASGNLKLVQWLVDDGRQWCTPAGVDAGIGGGHLHVLDFLDRRRPIMCTLAGLHTAFMSHRLYLASWARRHCPENHRYPFDELQPMFRNLGWSSAMVTAAFT